MGQLAALRRAFGDNTCVPYSLTSMLGASWEIDDSNLLSSAPQKKRLFQRTEAGGLYIDLRQRVGLELSIVDLRRSCHEV